MDSLLLVSRSRSNTSTAISASETGDKASPCQFFSGVLNIASASAPASRTASARPAACRCRSTTSVAGNSQALHAYGRRIGAVAEDEVVSRRQALEYFGQMPAMVTSLTGKVSVPFSIQKPSAAAIVASHQVDADPDQVGDIEAVRDLCDQRVGAFGAGGEMQVARPARRRRHAAIGVAVVARPSCDGRAIEEPVFSTPPSTICALVVTPSASNGRERSRVCATDRR